MAVAVLGCFPSSVVMAEAAWSQVREILDQHCILCHNPRLKSGRTPEGLDLTSYPGVMRVVIPGHPTKSAAFTLVNIGIMPGGGRPALSEKEKDTLYFWIYHGASNNLDPSSDWQWINQNLLRPHCLSCHGGAQAAAGLPLDFSSNENYQRLRPFLASELQNIIADGHAKHPTLNVPEALRKLFNQWRGSGARNRQVPQPNWQWIRENIVEKQCQTCHTGELIKLSDYEDVMTLVVPFDPENSPFYGVVASGFMPQDIPLDRDEIEAIYDWIKSGAEP